jgi:hypothetical protein
MRHNDVGSDRVLHTAVATWLTTSALCSHSTLNNLCNRHIHRFYTACELSATLQEHHGLSEHVLLPRRTPHVIRNFPTGRTIRSSNPGTDLSFLKEKASKHEANHPAPSSGKVTNERSYISTPPVACRNTGAHFTYFVTDFQSSVKLNDSHVV